MTDVQAGDLTRRVRVGALGTVAELECVGFNDMLSSLFAWNDAQLSAVKKAFAESVADTVKPSQ